MMEAKIYIADQRGCSDQEKERIWSTFNYGTFFHPDKGPFGKLYQLNEFQVDRNHLTHIPVKANTFQLFIPLHGQLIVQSGDDEQVVAIGQILCLGIDKDRELNLRAGGGIEKLLAFIQVAVQSEQIASFDAKVWSLSVDKTKNQMLLLTGSYYPFRIYMGVFYAKRTYHFNLQQKQGDVFLYSLEGACEVEERLLYEGDSLALKQVSGLDIECLSNAAILLAIEL